MSHDVLMVRLYQAVIGRMVAIASDHKMLACCCRAPTHSYTEVYGGIKYK